MYEEKIFEPGDILYHGTKKKISFCELGGTCETEPYGFSTDNFEYAKAYAGNKGKVLGWTPTRKIRILILSRESLKGAIDWIKDTYKERYIDDKVAKRIHSKDFANRSLKNINPDKQFKMAMKKSPSVYERIKKLKPYEFFSIGERFDIDKAKELLKGSIDIHDDVFLPGGLRAVEFSCVNYLNKISKPDLKRMEKENIGCGPISLTKSGYFRHSVMTFDVGLYHYLFKYIKHMKYDGVKLITNGFIDDVNAKCLAYNVEFVIDSKVLTKMDLPEELVNPTTKVKIVKKDNTVKKNDTGIKEKKQTQKECPKGKVINPKTNKLIAQQL